MICVCVQSTAECYTGAKPKSCIFFLYPPWGSLYDKLEKNNDKNSVIGKNVFTYESANCLINIPDEKLVVIQGLNDFIVVESENILLICRKKDEQKIKQFVNDVKLEKGEGYI